ncbi:fatty acyl-AMP ligase [Thermocatellispora tengchongensis]|uniref:fatty acyl-AMP ligase n=1 Tax=Thermocatellispora tengchongensis TaxID=1073253 RepID=UPI00363B8075
MARISEVGARCSYTFVTRTGGTTRDQVLTFAGLDREARSIAASLGERAAGGPVLLMFPTGLDFLRAFLGCMYAGVVSVPAPLPTSDPRALERGARIIADAGVRLVLTDAGSREELAGWLARDGLAGRVDCLALDDVRFAEPETWRMPAVRPHDVAYLQYTSGSTGEPRGVIVTQDNLLRNLTDIWRMIGSPETGVGAGWLPHYHDMGLVGQFLSPLYVGGSLAFCTPMSFVKRPALWLELISRHRAGYTAAPDFAYDWCAKQVPDEHVRDIDLSCLQVAMNGAEPVRAATLTAFEKRFAPVGFRAGSWRPVYGMAEATLLVTGLAGTSRPAVLSLSAADLERNRAVPGTGEAARQVVSCGRPVSLDVRVVDPASLAPLPDREIGEIWVRGASVAAGYWANPAATEETFQARLATGEGPYLRTGDVGFLDAGALYVTGRIKDILIVNGRNIYPQDVEETARESHPALGLGAAFTLGGDETVLVQEVRPSRLGGGSTPEKVAEDIAVRLARLTGLPNVRVVLVRNGTVERTTSGKVRRRHMRDLLLAGALQPVHERIPAAARPAQAAS